MRKNQGLGAADLDLPWQLSSLKDSESSLRNLHLPPKYSNIIPSNLRGMRALTSLIKRVSTHLCVDSPPNPPTTEKMAC